MSKASAKDFLLAALVQKAFGNPDERDPDVREAFDEAFPPEDEADEAPATEAPAKGAK